MLKRLYEWLLGCRHSDTTWPITDRTGQCYTVCTKCGATFSYDPVAWRRGDRIYWSAE